MELYADEMQREGFELALACSPAALAAECDLIVTATTADKPLLKARDLRPGTHITAMGADTPSKHELDPDVFAIADLCVVDSLSQCRERGELHHAIAAGTMTEEKVAELGQVIAGTSPRRSHPDQITICDLTGVAVQDIEISKAVMNKLRFGTG
jgi:ornithine cyclodeaminase